MSCPPLQTYADIDWATLRANALQHKGWRNKGPKEWDAKASSFAARNKSTTYVDLFLALLPLEADMSVLDVGSGPGTLAIPLAKQVHSVTAMDFSSGMLTTLSNLATAANLSNITTVHCAWEDDWHDRGIHPHDIAIASRAMGVRDLAPALRKINAFATKYVFISDRIGATPFDKAAFNAIGRPFAAGPDYIYTVNMLYTLGIHPNISVLTLEAESTFSSMEDALNSYTWMFNDITPEEISALEKYLTGQIVRREKNLLTIHRDSPPRWAVIWWKKEQDTAKRPQT